MRTLGVVIGLMALVASSSPAQRRDSVGVDSLAADTTDFSEIFLKTYEANRTRVPVPPNLGRRDLLPARTRIVFDRDTMGWHNAETISDILSKVPGVYLWRGGWIGRPEPINYQGRGAASAEFLIDGVPFLPLGPDSVSVDPSLFPLSFFDRIEVERLPGLLRVHLFTRRHDRLPPRTRVGVASGDLDIARYIVSLERRSKGGFGFVVAAEHLAVPLRSTLPGSYSNTQVWLQASYVPPNKRFGTTLQWIRAGPDREDIRTAATSGDTLSQGLDGSRSDLQATVFLRPGEDGLGLTGSLVAARSAWTEDSTLLTLGDPSRHVRFVDQAVWQIGGRFGHRTRVSSFDGEIWHRTRWTPLEARAHFGLTPAAAIAASGEAVYQRHDGARTSRWVTARGSLRLPLRLTASVVGRSGRIVAHPNLTAAPAVSITDLGALAGFEHPRLAIEGGLWRTAGFEPQTFPLYRTIDAIGPSDVTKWLTVSARLAPAQWFIIDGWYSNPVGSRPEGLPPTHSIVSATIQSRFLPTFRSGIFGLKIQGTMEAWGAGVIGRDAGGEPVPLKGATIFRALLQLKIGDFIAYYDRGNLQGTDLGYLPGLPIFRFASTFGVKWEFSN
ncbi:MAG: TonB-dependent receptor [Gemmatimonadales bacterium]